MNYRKLGSTGLDVSVLSFGASSLGSVFRTTDESESIRTVREALDCGINYIDVSPYYGLTKAETVLGKAIRDVPRDSFYLSTKAGRYGENEFDFSSKRIAASLEESLQRLNTDHVDLFFLHDIEFVEPAVILEEAMPTLQRLKQEGKIRHAGICGLPLELFRQMLPQIEVDAIISYCHYSLNDSTLLELLPLLSARQVGLVNASPLSMGLLGTRGAGLASGRQRAEGGLQARRRAVRLQRNGDRKAGDPVFRRQREHPDYARKHGQPGQHPPQCRLGGRGARHGAAAGSAGRPGARARTDLA